MFDLDYFMLALGAIGTVISILLLSYAIDVTISDWRWKNREWARRHQPDVRWR